MNDPEGISFPKADREYELIRAIGAGDILAFEMLVQRYRDPVLNFIYKYTGDRFGAEDIAQEVFLRVYRGASGFEPKGRVSTWIFKIAYNLCVNELLRRSRFCPISDVDEHELEGPEANDTGFKELEQEMMDAIGHLPEKQRAALLLRVNEELSYIEIGNILSTSISSVESLLFRARENLRKIIMRRSKE
ncbi:Transcriptional regulator, Fis family [Syntrophobacter sp. SbD1]|nr:Transcriptional regulator, Fis family [Syntrophobacter sp. SbD1]